VKDEREPLGWAQGLERLGAGRSDR